MKILFTGASSFTGLWFVKELSIAGNEVHTIFTQKDTNSYEGLRQERVKLVTSFSKPFFNIRFGDKNFLNLLKNEKYDILCHHAAFAKDYKNENFNLLDAINQNNNNIAEVFNIIKDQSPSLLLTGSYFEKGEGLSSDSRELSLYSLSKTVTCQIFKKYAEIYRINMGKFVVPNPFGPYQDFRFISYLFKAWKENKVATINTPDYIRDNIHVSLLAKIYAGFVDKLIGGNSSFLKINPSGYIESQLSFAQRVAREIRKRTGEACLIETRSNHVLNEPFILSNKEHADGISLSWNEEKAWDDLALFFKKYT